MNQLPAHLQNRQRRDLASSAMGGLNTGQPPHIAIAGNRFTLVDAAGNEKPIMQLYLDVCIIDANQAVSKIFYDPNVPYDPQAAEGSPPICFSDNGVGASASASQPQNTSCAMCPHNAWGSATSRMTGKQTKACNDVKKLAVTASGIYDQGFLLRVPPASLKNLAKYTQTLLGHGVDLPDVVTRLEFESQGVLKFTPVGYVDEATAQATDAFLAKNATDTLVGRNDRPWAGADAQKLAYAQQQGSLPPPPPQGMTPPFTPPPVPQGSPPGTQGPFGVPPSSPPSTGASAPGGADPFGQGGTSSPPAATPPKTRGRKPKPVEAPAPTSPPFMPAPNAPSAGASQFSTATTPPGAEGQMPGIPEFLQRGDAPPPPPAAPPQPTFGMNPNPPAPDAGMQAALDAAFRLPT